MPKALVVEDESALSRALQINLRTRGFTVFTASTGAEALRIAGAEHPDVVILDLGLPDISGMEVLAGIRGWSTMPVVVLSARSTSQEKVAALDAGADDYLTKPFSMEELFARLRVAQRRAAPTVDAEPVVSTRAFDIDLAAKRALRDGSEVKLTPTEWAIVETLVRNPGQLISQQQLLTDIWGPSYKTETNYLRVYLAHVRRKLEPDPSNPRYFLTQPGMGYRFEPDPS